MEIVRPVAHTGITADLVRKSKRHTSLATASLGPYSTQVTAVGMTAGLSATPGTEVPVIETVGGSRSVTVPLTCWFDHASGGDITVSLNVVQDGAFMYVVQVFVMDPLTGNYAGAYGVDAILPATPTQPVLSTSGSLGSTFTWSGTGWRRAASGPVVGWAEIGMIRTA